MDERTFLVQLAEQPNDETRQVYADWLDENGQSDKAEFLRLEYQMRTVRERLSKLVPTLDAAWLGAVYGYHALELLACAEGQKIATIKLIRDLSGKGLAESKSLSENLPSLVFRGTGLPLLEAKRRFEEIGATVRMVGSSADPSWLITLFGHGGLELRSYPSEQKIQVIKLIRELTGLGLKEAKDMSEQLPALVLEGKEVRLREAQAQFEKLGASVQLVLRSLPLE